MTVSAQIPSNQVTYAGVNTVVYAFRILASSDLVVSYDETAKTEGVHYTVTGVNNPSGGTVLLIGTLPTIGQKITVQRATSRVRVLDYQTSGDFLASQFNYDLDRLWNAIQELATVAAGGISIVVPPTEYGNFGLVLPAAADRALKALTFDADGNILMIPTADLGVVWGSLPIETTIDTVDRIIFYDVSAGLPKTITNASLIGTPLGDAVFRQVSGQALTAATPATLVFDLAVYNQLYAPRGSWVSNQYTATIACRVNFFAQAWMSMNNGETISIKLQVNGATVAEGYVLNQITGGFENYPVSTGKTVSLSPGDVVKFVIQCSAGRTLDNLLSRTFLMIEEKA